LAKDLMERNPDVVLVSNELGYGVVPIDAFDRKYREGTGRLCCLLAKEATEVHRVVCGLGQVIKGA
jgi:adenosyl cobinamide kinase/adenosyl cobinamide phosphate guanylyltransferase